MNLEPKLEIINSSQDKKNGEVPSSVPSSEKSIEKDDSDEMLSSEELQREKLQIDFDVLTKELFKKYGQTFWDLGDKKKFPLEINEEVRKVITDPKDWATYFRFAQAAYATRNGAKYEKQQGHPHIMHPSEKTIEKIEVNIADSSTREKYIENWPYKDFSLDEWEENGFLITKEGLPSKLEREYYELVRTGDFKKWFGDWEDHSDDQEVSKMIDPDTKEPKVFYRGDKSRFKPGFIVLDDDDRTYGEKNTGQTHSRKQGVFFTNNREVALNYGVDISAATLGKAGLGSKKDHPETFSKLKDWLESFANSHITFWKDMTDAMINGYGISDEDRKSRFHNLCTDLKLTKKEEDDLHEEVFSQRRRRNPEYYMDLFIKAGKFETLVDDFRDMFEENNKDRKAKDRPEWFLKFLKLKKDYQIEPLALSAVFIRSKNPKIETGIDMTETSEVHHARVRGHDAFINKEGVGGMKRADEIVVYDLKNIWVARKDQLDHSDVERVDKMNGITRF